MQDQDRPRFAMLIESLAASFRVEPSEALLEGYWLGLRSLPIESIEAAVVRAIETAEHMPRPADLRRGSGVLTPASRAVIAFDSVGRAIRTHGHRASVDFDDPLVNATVRNLGGWGRVCSLPPEEFEKWYRKDFTAVYTALCESGATPDACRYLPGLDEAENAAAYPERVMPPKRIATALPPHEGGRVLRLVSGK
jgi:hypothetical protein